MIRFTDGGLRNVYLQNGYIEQDTPYGKGVSYHDLDGLIKAICLALTKKPGKLTGAEFRYIRNNMLMSQKSLGEMLGCSEQAIAKWEKLGKIPKVADGIIRMIYAAKNDGHEKIITSIEYLNLFDRIANSKIIISEKRKKWVSEYHDSANELESV
jgi:putative transcriptional regulator